MFIFFIVVFLVLEWVNNILKKYIKSLGNWSSFKVVLINVVVMI